MRKRDRAAFVAAAGALAWLVWYEVLQCPGCRAEREARGARRARERHYSSHRRPQTTETDLPTLYCRGGLPDPRPHTPHAWTPSDIAGAPNAFYCTGTQ